MSMKSRIAQLIVDMHVLEKRPINKPELVELIKEVNNSKMIGNACRIKTDMLTGKPIYIQKYRLTTVEKQLKNAQGKEL